jgi:hypothetical protein
MTTSTLKPNTQSTENIQRVRFARLWWVGLLAILLSVIATLVVRAIGVALITVSPEFVPLSMFQATVFFTVTGVLAAIIVFAIVGRFARQPVRTYTIIAIVALLLSLVPDVMIFVDPANAPFPGATQAGAVVLMVQHVVAAIVTVWLLNTLAVERRPA